MAKPKILILALHYLPGYKAGGPIRSIANLVDALKEQFEFTIITRDRDMGDLVPYPGLPSSNTVEINSAKIIYLRDYQLKFSYLKELINNVDYSLLYLNSVFCINFTIKPLILYQFGKITKTPVLLAPRGELSQGGLSIKPIRKFIFLLLSRTCHFYKGIQWQATNNIEANQIGSIFGKKADIHVASNIFKQHVPHSLSRTLKQSNFLNMVYMSRITQKKNLLFLLKLLESNRDHIHLDIYGPIEEKGYWEKCKKQIRLLPANIKIKYMGSCKTENVTSTLEKYHLFVLPTKAENYGHVILEALSSGTPVLISDQTPWHSFQIGDFIKAISLNDIPMWHRIIKEYTVMNDIQLQKKREMAKYFSNNINQDSDTSTQTQSMLKSIMSPQYTG